MSSVSGMSSVDVTYNVCHMSCMSHGSDMSSISYVSGMFNMNHVSCMCVKNMIAEECLPSCLESSSRGISASMLGQHLY